MSAAADSAFDLSAGAYRNLVPQRKRSRAELATLRRDLGVAHPTEGVSTSPAVRDVAREWYDRALLSRRTVTTRKVGKRLVTTTDERTLTVGMAIGAGALILGWEAGQSIAHGLAGLNPSSWVDDIEAWVSGTPTTSPSLAENSVGGIIEAHLVALLNPPPPAPSDPTGTVNPPPPPNTPPPAPGSPPPSPYYPVSGPYPIEPIV